MLNNLSFTSQSPSDKIVAVYEDSFSPGSAETVGSGSRRRHTIEHSFTRPVFTKLLISRDNSSWQDGGGVSDAISSSDSDNIYIYTDRDSGTLYYRVIAFWINDYDSSNPLVPPTTGSSSSVYFDSRLNYQKIAVEEEASHDSGIGPHSNTITHNLGYKPNARVFFEAFPGEVWPSNFGGLQNKWLFDFEQVECDYAINDNTVVIQASGGVDSPSRKTWGVVYYDG